VSEAHWGAVGGLVERGGSILLVREQGPDENEPHWAIPGGVIEEGESIIAALRRELREEAGIAVEKIGSLLYVSEIADDAFANRRFVVPVFGVLNWRGEPKASGRDPFVLEARFVPKPQAAPPARKASPDNEVRRRADSRLAKRQVRPRRVLPVPD